MWIKVCSKSKKEGKKCLSERCLFSISPSRSSSHLGWATYLEQASGVLQPAQRSRGRLCRRAQEAKRRSDSQPLHLRHLLSGSLRFSPGFQLMSLKNTWWNINFFTNADRGADLSHDGYDCNSGAWLPAGAPSYGETHQLSEWKDFICTCNTWLSLQSVLGALVIVNLKGMLMQFREILYLWRRDKPDCVCSNNQNGFMRLCSLCSSSV